jgi:hypothetical protein
MPLLQLDTENADRDLTSIITVLTDTPHATKATLCQGLVLFGDGAKNLDGTGGDFELTVTVGGQTIQPQPDPQAVTFSTAVRSAVWTTIFPVPANTEVILRAKSPNAADTDVDVTAYLYEVTGGLPDAAPDAAGGLPVSDAGGLDMDAIAAGVTLNTLIISPVGGTTDGDGNVGGTTVVDSTRSETTDHWNNLAIEITSGTLLGQSRTIKTYTSGVVFTVTRPFTAQVPTGVTYRVISATVYQPGIAIVKNHPAIVEPDTLSYMGIACITNEGSPLDGDLTAGTITIYRIRAGASTTIVSGAACALLTGNIYYAYTFPAASWQAGDMYRAQMSGQEVTVNGIVYPLAIISMEGRISREAVIEEDTGTTIPALIAAVPTAVLDQAVTNNPSAKEYTLRFVICMMMNSNLVDNSGFLTVYDTTDTEIVQLPVTTSSSAKPVTGVS